jgi:hypothetical protein
VLNSIKSGNEYALPEPAKSHTGRGH